MQDLKSRFKDNIEVVNAISAIENMKQGALLITGKAGTGKSTFLKEYASYCQSNGVNVIKLAPTGIASINIDGQSIHSFFNLPPRPLEYKDKEIKYFRKATYKSDGKLITDEHYKRSLISNADIIIIDEISMVRADVLDAIDYSLRRNGGNYSLPFGGKKMIFFGDPYQLSPVVTNQEKDIISDLCDSPFFFSAKVFQETSINIIELKKIYRQNDKVFIALLNNIRDGHQSNKDLSFLNQRVVTVNTTVINDNVMTLCSTNKRAEVINEKRLSKLNNRLYSFKGNIVGNYGNILPSPMNLDLKKGAQIMFVKNDNSFPQRWVNGTIGTIDQINETELKVQINNTNYNIERVEWEKLKYTWNKKKKEISTEVIGTYSQFPIKLAWAITIHKSQGLTFEKINIDKGGGRMFAHGQCYVALSRCKSLEGINLIDAINYSDIIINQPVINFMRNSGEQNNSEKFNFNRNIDKIITSESITRDLFTKGYTIDMIVNERGYKRETIISHLLKSHQRNSIPDIDRIKPSYQVCRAVLNEYTKQSSIIAAGESIKLRGIFDALGGNVNYDDIRLSLLFVS